MKLRNFGYATVIAVAAVALIIGSTGTGEAKNKKKTAAPAVSPIIICPFDYKPVCANDHGWVHTFSNACVAHAWGAKIIHRGAC